jgi:hypothetical protein
MRRGGKKMPRVRCEWDVCKLNEDGYCTNPDEIELVNVTVKGNEFLICSEYDGREVENQ